MDKELIEHITSQLQHHEESYSDGAWERFSAKENKPKRFVYWPLWVAAALILVFGGVFFSLNEKTIKSDMAVNNSKPITQKPDEENTLSSTENSQPKEKNQLNLPLIKENQSIPGITVASNQSQKRVEQYHSLAVHEVIENDNRLENSLTAINLASANNRSFDIYRENKKEKVFKKPTFEDILAHDSKFNEFSSASKSQKDSKWEPGVYVAPAMGNDNKVNMNYGFSLSYAIDKKLSISSGVSYASLSSTESLDASAPQTLSGKNLESVNAKVQGINIPLELKYNISDKLYTGVGISALAVLNNSQQNTYLINQVQSMPMASSSGAMEQKNFIVAEKTSEPQPESAIDPDKYIGFYNFSIGYKQKISPKKNIAIEPFLRLPMKTFSKENLNLTNGGLRLKIDF
ncbi:hypothetical protein DU508_15610 [Pedobacter chinensis]|uniref:Outer membrane protein beta-barrel domain-containing protein n=1 Tax=Pedobacter chinensis TaxID=2282421 RepID=A0A369PWX7_9SPHI|nr:outer membrane beta-barrel protein [Pedobacter chinensis]RDC55695.1 hypothetical protein DU508_15610 [Pedobacter chinensis]